MALPPNTGKASGLPATPTQAAQIKPAGLPAAYKLPVSVLVVLFAPDGRFLLLERADRAGFWQSVTGSVDAADEPLHQAALREVQEETGFALHWNPDQTVLGGGDAARAVGVGACAVEPSGAAVFRPEPWQLYAWPHALQYDIYPHWRHRYAPGVVRNTEHWFAACVPSAALPVISPREHVGHAWLPAGQAAERCFSPNNAEAIVVLATKVQLAS